MIRRLDPATQTLYAELLERSIQFEAADVLGVAGSGSFVEKRIKGRTYWYLQKSVGRDKRQFYLGPDSERLRSWLVRVQEVREDSRQQREDLHRLCAMVVSGGARRESGGIAKVLEVLREAGVFRLGGVLVGTVAFRAYGALLGVRLDEAARMTQDIDIAQEPDLAVGLVPGGTGSSVGDRLLGSEIGMQPIPALDPKSPSTSYTVRSRNLRVDFLVPARGAQKETTVFLPSFGLSATPLRFLEYLIEAPLHAVVLGPRPVLVNIPDVARFAIHKMYTAITRPASFSAKSAKDIRQASNLFEVLIEDRPDDLVRAWRAVEDYPNVRSKLRRSIDRLGSEVAADLLGIIGSARE